jgi:DNA-binding response OmpR family regulator
MKIRIIEDDPASLKLTSDVVQGGGPVVMLATSADQAIYSIRAVRPDVILLDLRLPGIKGFGVASQCRGDETLKAGCDACIVKPINTRTLQQIEEVVAAKARNSLSKLSQ